MGTYLLDFDWTVMAPELVIVITAALLTILDLILKEKYSYPVTKFLSIWAVGLAGYFVITGWGDSSYQILADTYRVDPFSLLFKGIFLLGTLFILLFSFAKKRINEYYYLLLTALLGAMMMVSAADLITLYVGLELLSISSYILVGIQKRKKQANEAAWKYMILGGASSAFILYGMSFLYGLSGSTNLYVIQQAVQEGLTSGYGAFVYLSFALIIIGFGFKISTAPFHTWAPDVYQGAQAPITAFLASISKAAGFALMLRVLILAFSPLFTTGDWERLVSPLLLTLAALSMIVGNTVALKQTNAKRLMAYSSIAQAGYLLVPLATMGMLLFPSMVFYLIVYIMMVIAAFVIVEQVTDATGDDDIRAFAGLYQRSPLLSLVMTVLLISLAGLPITAGFVGKVLLISNAIYTQHFVITFIMIATTVVSYYYYFGIIRQIYFRSPANQNPIPIRWEQGLILGMSIAMVLGLGLFPGYLIQFLGEVDWGSAFQMATNSGR
ncbi:NADH-quinone oxidoreductase subunit N [Hazenella sp. IB182357]|uniref:NADH-quinone oxidoreductase subunit N n=1 Tax=Polycladospora coralii TaxID=2771432 RepID=A0A926RU54_9BACL|nr:NADH-quinone oxidoreductase subunit N [Polycladospora coralii]MBD1372152.1 NADH-quinone oxidoreductase subunit N [Polycladospora coralii]